MGRLLAQRLTEAFGRQPVADNRPGGGALIGRELVARAAPDDPNDPKGSEHRYFRARPGVSGRPMSKPTRDERQKELF